MVVSIEFDRLIRTWWCTNAHPGLQWVSSTNILVVMKGLMMSRISCVIVMVCHMLNIDDIDVDIGNWWQVMMILEVSTQPTRQIRQ